MKRSAAASLGLLLVITSTAALAQFSPPSFDSLDTDESGELSLEEVSSFFARFAGGGPRGNVGAPPGGMPAPEAIFARWDTDASGAVSKAEWDDRPRRGPGGQPAQAPQSLPPDAF